MMGLINGAETISPLHAGPRMMRRTWKVGSYKQKILSFPHIARNNIQIFPRFSFTLGKKQEKKKRSRLYFRHISLLQEETIQ